MPLIHHRRVEQLQHLERKLMLELADNPDLLSPYHVELLRYALSFARLGVFPAPKGDVDLFEFVAPFRHWLIAELEFIVSPQKRTSLFRPVLGESIDWKALTHLMERLHARLAEARTHLLTHHSSDFSEEMFEDELCNRRLVLVLGGGGGSGYPHLGAFSVIAELGLVPSLIVGSSMGALLGLFRSISHEYDPMATTMGLPRPREFRRVFAPYRGFSRFGFPGVFELKMRPVASEIFNTLLGRSIPRLNELPIPFRPVVTGLRSGIGLALNEVEREISRSERAISAVRIGRRFSLFAGTIRRMLQNPRLLSEVVFGSDEQIRDIDAIDAVGFSCAVPGFIHYDIFRQNTDTAPALRRLFQDRGLFRITDGGVVANVPSRIAWDCVHRGEITHRNTFILSFDAFAPVRNLNAPFIPVQQLIRQNVLEHKRYSDFHLTYHFPPSPVRLLQSFDALQKVVTQTRNQLNPYRSYLALSLRRIPRWQSLTP